MAVGLRAGSGPPCRNLTTGPRTEASSKFCIGAVGNGIWLCQNCAKLIDNDCARYTVTLLRTWKAEAEAAALAEIEGGTETGAHPEIWNVPHPPTFISRVATARLCWEDSNRAGARPATARSLAASGGFEPKTKHYLRATMSSLAPT